MVSEQLEREDKFDVGPGFVVPDLTALLPDGGRVETARHRLDNTYYDTAAQDLRRLRLTLRHRVGGPDAGWHLKVPAGAARTEVRSGSRARTVPKALADLLLGVRRGAELVPVASLAATRDVLRLLDGAGTLLAELADDQVESATPGDGLRPQSWRELEIELGPAGDEELLAVLGARVVEWGATLSAYRSKLARALGEEPGPAPSSPPETVGEVVQAYLAEQCDAIVDGDLGLRLERSVVHPTRVAIRRLRSTLRVYGRLFDEAEAEHLDAELVWYAGLLGEVRDREVLGERLRRLVAELPPELVLGPVSPTIEARLHTERTRALRAVRVALAGGRYAELLQTLERWRTAPPVTEEASRPAARVAHYVDRAEQKLYSRLRQAGTDPEALHRARKAGKRFRYAAELSEVVRGKKASRAIAHAKKLQELLGEHQDSMVSAEFLRRLGAAAGTSGDQNGFTYGLLLGVEGQRAADVRRKLAKRYG